MTSLKIAHNADNNGVRNIRHRYYTADMKHLCASLLKLVLRCNGYAVRCFSFGTEPLETYIYAVPKENGENFNFASRYLLMADCQRTGCKVLSVWLVIWLADLLESRFSHSASPEKSHILYQLKVTIYCCHNNLPFNDTQSQRIQSKS
jgi:hypothetical protein